VHCDKMMVVKTRVVFMGTPEFALPTLEKLVESHTVVGVVTQPDRQSGRGRRVATPPVKELALAEGIPVFQPNRLRNAEAVEHIRAWAPDVAVVAAYGQILRPSVLEIPPFGVLNVHASLLPRWRGASPIQGALLAGDTTTGVTIMKMDKGLDTGPILGMRETPIGSEETAGDLEARLAVMGADLLMELMPAYLAGELTPQPQPDEGVTITRRLRKEQACLEWSDSAESLHNQVRAFSPAIGSYTFWDGRRVKILRSEVVVPEIIPESGPGSVFLWQEMPVVVTGQGCLKLVYVQMAGKRPMDGGAFVRGRTDLLGTRLSSQKPGE
jgi:methionyl-tRNA formyltransferase